MATFHNISALFARRCVIALPIFFFVLVLGLMLAGCGGSESAAEKEDRICIAGEPRPIFKQEDTGVHEHKFLPDGQFSQEHIRFKSGELLSIMQKGCDTIVQTFELPVPDTVQSWPSLKRVFTERIYRYANLEPRLYSFKAYADFLEVIPDDFPVAQPVNRAPGLIIRFFKLPTAENTTWQIVYEQDMTQVKSSN